VALAKAVVKEQAEVPESGVDPVQLPHAAAPVGDTQRVSAKADTGTKPRMTNTSDIFMRNLMLADLLIIFEETRNSSIIQLLLVVAKIDNPSDLQNQDILAELIPM
jgi:hypothetical protein